MELSGEAWAALSVVGTAITGVVAYLVKAPLDASRKRAEDDATARQKRQEELEASSKEMVELQKTYIKTATESNAANAATNAKQATDLAQQRLDIGVLSTAIGTVSDTTKTVQSALREFASFGRILIKQLPSPDDQNQAQQHLNEIVSILGHKR